MSLPLSKKKSLQKKRLPPRRRPRKSGLNESNTETKLNRISIHYEYLFEWGVNFKDRVITISDEIDSGTFDVVDSALTEMEAEGRKAVTVKINCLGGNVYDALAIVGRLKASKCQIITEGYGAVMSAATLILACGDKRRISYLSWFMTHEATYSAKGKHSEIVAEVRQAERENRQWATAMESFTQKDAKFWENAGKGEDAYFTPEELLSFGVVDEVFGCER